MYKVKNMIIAVVGVVLLLALVTGLVAYFKNSENISETETDSGYSNIEIETSQVLHSNSYTYSWVYDPDDDCTYFGFTGMFDPLTTYKIDFDIPFELSDTINICPTFLRGPMSDYTQLTANYIINIGTDLSGRQLRSGSINVTTSKTGYLSFFYGFVDGNITADTTRCYNIIQTLLDFGCIFDISRYGG